MRRWTTIAALAMALSGCVGGPAALGEPCADPGAPGECEEGSVCAARPDGSAECVEAAAVPEGAMGALRCPSYNTNERCTVGL